jgi:hypothetical protein
MKDNNLKNKFNFNKILQPLNTRKITKKNKIIII